MVARRSASALSNVLAMAGRSLLRSWRSMDLVIFSLVMPPSVVAMFTFIFGGAVGAPGASYAGFALPAAILVCVGFNASNVAVGVSVDLASGLAERFRSLPLRASSLLTGYVLASVLRAYLGAAAAFAAAFLLGYRPALDAAALAWAALALLLYAAAAGWLSVFCGLAAPGPEAAEGFGMLFFMLPYFSSGFVPSQTMRGAFRAFAESQPANLVILVLRSSLSGGGPGPAFLPAAAWCVALSLVAYAASRAAYARK